MPKQKNLGRISSHLIAKSKGKQLSNSLFLSANHEPFIMPTYDVLCTWGILYGLYYTCCGTEVQFTTEEREYFIKSFPEYEFIFIGPYWVSMKRLF